MHNTVSLRKNFEFYRVYKRGKFKSGAFVTVSFYKTGKDYRRLGISVGKKTGNSVQRSRVTRLIRENYRLMEDELQDGYDIVISAKALNRKAPGPNRKIKATSLPTFYDIKKDLNYLFRKLDLVKEQ